MNEKQNPPAVAPGSALGCPVRQQSCLLDSGDRSLNKGEKKKKNCMLVACFAQDTFIQIKLLVNKYSNSKTLFPMSTHDSTKLLPPIPRTFAMLLPRSKVLYYENLLLFFSC